MQRLLVIRGGAVGDFVVTLPVFGVLRQAMPHAFIEVLGKSSRAILAHHPAYADAVTDLDAWDIYRLFNQQPTISEALATYLRSFATIFSYLPSTETAFTDNLRRYCPGEVVAWSPHPRGDRHITEHLLQAVTGLLPQIYDPCPHVYIAPEAYAAAEQFWHGAGLPEHGVVAIHPGSGGRHKLWPLAGWKQLMTWITQQGLAGLIVCGPAEPERDIRLLQEATTSPWPATRPMPLPHLAALLARCQVVVGHDSGVTHLAAAVGATTLALFGPTDPGVWGPRSPRACVLQPPCRQPLTLHNVAPEVVTQTLDALLRRTFVFVPSQVPCTPVRLWN